MKEKNGKIGALGIFLLPVITLVGIAPYAGVLKFTEILHIYTRPLMLLIFFVSQGSAVFYIHICYRKLKGYMAGKIAEKLDVIQELLIAFPKKLLVTGLLSGVGLPQIMLFFQEQGPVERWEMLSIGYANCIFFSMLCYIFFIQNFEKWTKSIPFSEKYLSMRLSIRINLVSFFAITSMSATLLVALKNHLSRLTEVADLSSHIISTGIPIVLVGITGGLVNIFLLMRGITHRIAQCGDYAGSLAEGDVSRARLDTVSRDELGILAYRLGIVRDNMNDLISSAQEAMEHSLKVKNDLTDVAETTMRTINSLMDHVENAVTSIKNLDKKVDGTTSAIESFSSRINTVSGHIREQSSMVEESSAGVSEIIDSLERIAALARSSMENTVNLDEASDTGNEKIEETSVRLNEISKLVDNIRSITALIQSIAEQTNLLAMNAAIEAAHAGEAGRGFAVVADEIGKLAEHASVNSREINSTVEKIVDAIEKAAAAGNSSAVSFTQIKKEIRHVLSSFTEIDSTLNLLKQGGEEILTTVSALNKSSAQLKENADAMQSETGDTSREMQELRRLSASNSQVTNTIINEILVVITQSEALGEQTRRLDKATGEVALHLKKFKTSV